MTNVIHISDTHIVPDGYLVADRLNTVQQLHKLVKYLTEHAPEYGPIDAIILSGDVSDDGSLESYSCFKEIMQSLKVPVYVVPGNHDLRENMRKSFLDEGYIPKEGRLNWHRNIGDIQLIGLDSLKEGFGEGELDSDTLFFLRTTLDRVDNAPVILMLHHPPFKSGIKFMDKIGLKTGLDEFKNIVKTYPGSMRIVCGHIHSIMVSTVENKTVISAPSPASSLLFNVQDDAPAGFMDIGEGCFIHRWEEGFQSIKLSNSLSNGPFPF